MWRLPTPGAAALAGAAIAAAVLATPPAADAATAHDRAAPALTARVVVPTAAKGAPRQGARTVMPLRGATAYTGSAQRLLVTGRHTDRAGRDWVRVQLPVRPNGTSGWVRADRVRLSATRVRIEVRLDSRRLEIWRGARRLHAFTAGVGRPATPTPVGRFAIQDPVPTLPGWRSVYGGWTLTLTAHSNVLRSFMGGDGLVAIHGAGTGRAWRVGKASSFGCVILGERELAITARYARPGTPVIISRG